MRVLIAGNQRRDVYCKHLLEDMGFSVSLQGPWDTVVLPLPRSEIRQEWLPLMHEKQNVVCGLTDPGFDRLAKEKGWRLFRVLEDREYAEKNACLTAEGALFAAAYQLDSALMGLPCLVVGYGRIGKALTERLRALGAKVCVAARRQESRAEAGGGIAIEDIENALPHMRLVFNTVPAPVIGKKELGAGRPGTMLMELASAPYGIDLETARQMGINCTLESGVPGRYCPRSAAEALIEYMKREGILYA